MKSFFSVFFLMMCLMLNSCGQVNAEDTLAQAEADITSNNIERAITSCEILADTTAYQLSATQMCRLAIIYARASELSDSQDYMATAAHCYERAVALDHGTDSLAVYIEGLDIEGQGMIREIRQLSYVLNNPYDIADSEEAIEPDSSQQIQ